MARTSREVQTPGAPAEKPVEHSDDEQLKEPEAEAPAAGQLRAADVNPATLRRAVLTADGWVCPATSPAPAAKE